MTRGTIGVGSVPSRMFSRVRRAMIKSSWLVAAALFARFCFAADVPFPAAPRSAADAEAQGLQRVEARTLAAIYGGVREAQNLKGEITRQELRPDGTLIYSNDKGVSGTGRWSVVDEQGGMICRTFDFQGGRRFCTLYYAAPDGVHLFGYNPQDRLWRITTRRIEAH
jgi:hypothetical protein